MTHAFFMSVDLLSNNSLDSLEKRLAKLKEKHTSEFVLAPEIPFVGSKQSQKAKDAKAEIFLNKLALYLVAKNEANSNPSKKTKAYVKYQVLPFLEKLSLRLTSPDFIVALMRLGVKATAISSLTVTLSACNPAWFFTPSTYSDECDPEEEECEEVEETDGYECDPKEEECETQTSPGSGGWNPSLG